MVLALAVFKMEFVWIFQKVALMTLKHSVSGCGGVLIVFHVQEVLFLY